ncbi:hypothetical protein K438DRAFT_1533547, partial [Mycena galopus ATCC 62051]
AQTPEARRFIDHIVGLPRSSGVCLDGILTASLNEETEIRRLFSTDRAHLRLTDPYVGLVDVFDAPGQL